MKCATRPCRQGTASCGTCVEKPKYPRAMRALAVGNAIPGASAQSGCWITHIPTDLVVAQDASDVESSSCLDFLLLPHLRRRFVA